MVGTEKWSIKRQGLKFMILQKALGQIRQERNIAELEVDYVPAPIV